jgi:hypothetical protein
MPATSKTRPAGPFPSGRLLDIAAHRGITGADAPCVLWPAAPRSGLTPLLAGLAPNRDHNADLVEAVQALPRHREGAQPVFAVFAADPFLNVRRIASTLRARKYSCVVNWPTTAQFGTPFASGLDSVSLGPKQECEALRRLASQGLRVSAAVAEPGALPAFLELDPQWLFVTPAFEHWRHGKIDPARLLRSCAAIARAAAGRAPLILMADRGVVTAAQARSAGAQGLVVPGK